MAEQRRLLASVPWLIFSRLRSDSMRFAHSGRDACVLLRLAIYVILMMDSILTPGLDAGLNRSVCYRGLSLHVMLRLKRGCRVSSVEQHDNGAAQGTPKKVSPQQIMVAPVIPAQQRFFRLLV